MTISQRPPAEPGSAFALGTVGFFGLGAGYLIYGAQELFGLPECSRSVDLSTGIWKAWRAVSCSS